MQKLYQTADAGDTLSDCGCISLSIRQRMQEILYKTADAELYIRQRMQEILYQTADAETLYQTAESGDTLSDSGCRSLSIRQRMQEALYQTADA